MRIQLFGGNKQLEDKLRDTGFFTLVDSVMSTEGLHESADILYLGEPEVHFNELAEIRAKHPDAEIYYHLRETKDLQLLKRIRDVIDSANAHLLLPHLTVAETVEKIVELFVTSEDQRANPIVVFVGAISGIGTSSTVHSVAKRIHQLSDSKIIVLGLDEWDPGTTLLNYEGRYLDELKVRLSSRDLTPDQLVSLTGDFGYRFLAGNRRLRLQKKYNVDEISFLINMARNAFDLVLIDGGSHFDNACTLESLKAAGLRYLITVQSTKAIQRYNTYRDEILFKDFSLIVNRYQAIPELMTSRNLASEYDMPLITAIPDLQNLGMIAEMTKRNLLDVAGKDYENAIDMIARSIIRRFNLNMRAEVIERENQRRMRFLRIGGAARANQ